MSTSSTSTSSYTNIYCCAIVVGSYVPLLRDICSVGHKVTSDASSKINFLSFKTGLGPTRGSPLRAKAKKVPSYHIYQKSETETTRN